MASSTLNDDLCDKTFQHNWMIKNWVNLMQNETLMANTSTEIQCGENNLEYARFSVGFITEPQGNCIRLYWKLLRKHYCLHYENAILFAEILNKNGATEITIESQAKAVVGATIDTETDIFVFPDEWTTEDIETMLNSEGVLTIKLQFTLKKVTGVTLVRNAKAEEFQTSFKDEYSHNLSALFEDTLCSDVKIVTKDKAELHAHKVILRARCPIFTSMFGSKFLQSGIAILNVDDISAKTMTILLKFWYTGELLPLWKDDDIVSEFTYAVGKYQMTKVLEMLDAFLGVDFEETNVDVKLLKILQNLPLQSAETRILKHFIYKISNVTSGIELLKCFSLSIDEIYEEGDLAALQILKEFDDVMSEQQDDNACVRHVKLLALACKLNIKHVEHKLLKRIVGTVKKVTNAEELFALFDIKVEANAEDSSDRDLLVRANPK